jgi:3-keto-L-gulonate-6-phosphate decarboxylase
VDGGVGLAEAKKLLALGVSNVIVGSGILRAKNPVAALTAFEALESPYGV